MLHNNGCNKTNLCSYRFYKNDRFYAVNILYLLSHTVHAWFKQLALLCHSIKPLPSRKNHSCYTKLQTFSKKDM